MSATLRGWFRAFTEETGETPTHIVMAWAEWREPPEAWPLIPSGFRAWDEVAPEVLDHRFDSGFGANTSPDLCAWSPSWVLFSDNYDGAEGLCWVPRNPADHQPIRPGGG